MISLDANDERYDWTRSMVIDFSQHRDDVEVSLVAIIWMRESTYQNQASSDKCCPSILPG